MTPRSLHLLAVLALGWLAAAAPAVAQESAGPRIPGRVLRDGAPLSGIRVMLHRIAADLGGPVDSTTTDGRGGFVFRLGARADSVRDEVVYFASVRHQGILYFGTALPPDFPSDSLYTIQVFDTVTAPPEGAALAVEVRHVILEQDSAGWRATDLVQLRHPDPRTYVAADGGATWSYPLPAAASDFEVGEGDLAPDAVALRDGRVWVTAPIPPGERLYLFRYRLADRSFELPLPGTTARLELLVREPAPPLVISRLEAQPPVELEGNTYRRWAGATLRDMTVRIQESPPGKLPVAWVAAALALVLGAGALYAFRHGQAPAAAPLTREALLIEIARLDEQFAAPRHIDAETRRQYLARRAVLKEQLRALDARGKGIRARG
ncbi:MAG: hypothetical protein HY704_03000 [Gemmatimonadetes bacterium]|nr:hypothetical protein [Gemmatimonadota bacterium]